MPYHPTALITPQWVLGDRCSGSQAPFVTVRLHGRLNMKLKTNCHTLHCHMNSPHFSLSVPAAPQPTVDTDYIMKPIHVQPPAVGCNLFRLWGQSLICMWKAMAYSNIGTLFLSQGHWYQLHKTEIKGKEGVYCHCAKLQKSCNNVSVGKIPSSARRERSGILFIRPNY